MAASVVLYSYGSDTSCDIPPPSKDGQSKPGSIRGANTEALTHNTHIHGLNKELLHEFLHNKRGIQIMKCSSLKHSGSQTKILSLGDTRARIGPKLRSPRLLLTGQAPKSPPKLLVRHWATPNCHSSHNTLASLHTIGIHKQGLSN
jgi:hypothetical protein